jgi:hypothetical protein
MTHEIIHTHCLVQVQPGHCFGLVALFRTRGGGGGVGGGGCGCVVTRRGHGIFFVPNNRWLFVKVQV